MNQTMKYQINLTIFKFLTIYIMEKSDDECQMVILNISKSKDNLNYEINYLQLSGNWIIV